MKKKTRIIAIAAGLLLIQSCNDKIGKEEDLLRRWQITSYDTPSIDSMAQIQLKSLDTIKVMDTAFATFLGVHTFEEYIAALRERIESYKKDQTEAAVVSSVQFFKNGDIVFYTGPETDTNKWEMIGKNKIILSPKRFEPTQDEKEPKKDTAVVETLSKDKLRLLIPQGQSKSYINMRPFTSDDSLNAVKKFQEAQEDYERQIQELQQRLSDDKSNAQ